MHFLMQAYIEKEDSKKLKQKQRERMQPKMGKMDIDYQVSLLFTLCCVIRSQLFQPFLK
jgi:ribonuclease HII